MTTEALITIELTGPELATLLDAAVAHQHATLDSDLRRDHPIFTDLENIRAKLSAAYAQYTGADS